MKKLPAVLVLAALVSAPASAQPPAAKNFVAHLSGVNEVPIRETNATGQAIFQSNATESQLAFKLIVANIDNVIAAHIHVGTAGTNGPVVAFLFGAVPPGGGRLQGVIAEGLIGSADLVGPLAGQDLSVLLAALRTGGAYVNVHTDDGAGEINTGPGDFPGGEIRGQIRSGGPSP